MGPKVSTQLGVSHMRARSSAAFVLAAATVLGLASTVAAGTATTEPGGTEPAGTEAAGTEAVGTAAPAIDAEWWAAAAEPYAGTTIHGVSESTPPSVYAAETLAAQFEDLTGIKVELETTSWDEMRSKALNDMVNNTGTYDFIYLEQDIVYADIAAERLGNVTALLEQNPDLQAPGFSSGQLQHLPRELRRTPTGTSSACRWRRSSRSTSTAPICSATPKIQAAFKDKYGYDSPPATTHEQYSDIAEFFTA